MAAIDRHSKTISFGPYVVEFAKRILIPSSEGLEILKANLTNEKGSPSCRAETMEVMHAALAPGSDLEQTTQAFVRSLSDQLDTALLQSSHGNLLLFSWVRKLGTRASTDAIYGVRDNPFRDDEVEKGFW